MGNTCIIQILVLITKIFFKNEKFRCTFQLLRCKFGPTVFLWVACMWSVYSLLLMYYTHSYLQCNIYAVEFCTCTKCMKWITKFKLIFFNVNFFFLNFTFLSTSTPTMYVFSL